MTRSTRRRTVLRTASAFLAGVVTIAFAPGCDTAPQTESVNMGGKEGRAKIQPGAPAAPADATAKPKAKGKGESGRSIKDRPGGEG